MLTEKQVQICKRTFIFSTTLSTVYTLLVKSCAFGIFSIFQMNYVLYLHNFSTYWLYLLLKILELNFSKLSI